MTWDEDYECVECGATTSVLAGSGWRTASARMYCPRCWLPFGIAARANRWLNQSESEREEVILDLRGVESIGVCPRSDAHSAAADLLEKAADILVLVEALEHHRESLRKLVKRGTDDVVHLLTDLDIEEILEEREPWLGLKCDESD